VGFGTELLFVLVLGFLLLGPKKLPVIFGQIARAKAQLRHATRDFTSQLDAAIESHSRERGTTAEARTGGQQ
jgi:Sec-independent protein translocase protein TatA